MKVNTIMAIFFSAVFATGAWAQEAAPLGVNLLTNGGFENVDDLDGMPLDWTWDNLDVKSTEMEIVTEEKHSGKNCVSLKTTPEGSEGILYSPYFKGKMEWFDGENDNHKPVPVTLSYWAKPKADKQNVLNTKLELQFFDENGGNEGSGYVIFDDYETRTFEKANEWNYISVHHDDVGVSQNLPWHKVVNFRLRMSVYAFYYDDVSVLLDDVSLILGNATEGIESMSQPLPIKAEGTTLYVAANDGEQIRVFTVDGSQVAAVAAERGTTKITNLPKGLLLVKAGKQTGKVLIK